MGGGINVCEEKREGGKRENEGNEDNEKLT